MRFWRGRRRTSPKETWLTWAARFGYAACGTIYSVIGIAAIAAALGFAREPTGSHGALHFFAELPLGPVALALVGVGLAGYAALNFVGAVLDPEERGVTPWGLLTRGVDVLTGALYIVFSVTALAMIVDPQHRAQGAALDIANRIRETPFGTMLLTTGGVGLILSGIYLFYRAAREPFGEMLDRRSLSAVTRRAIAIAARAGTAARGVIFGICGLTLVLAAEDSALERAGDIGDALSAIGSTTFGPFFLGLIGAGFVAYGGYQLAKSRYQRIADPVEGVKNA